MRWDAWDADVSSPIDDIRASVAKIRRATGVQPNTIILGYEVARMLHMATGGHKLPKERRVKSRKWYRRRNKAMERFWGGEVM